MAQRNVPSYLKKGHQNKNEKQSKIEEEKKLSGHNDKVYTAPDNLSEDAAEYYSFIVNELEISGILSNLDIPLLSQLAETLSYLDLCNAEINEKGLLVQGLDRNGEPKLIENPASQVKLKYLREFKSLSNQVGLSPSSRSQLVEMNVTKQQQEEDPLLKLLTDVHGEGIKDNL